MLRILLSVFNYPVNNTIFEFQINNYFTLKKQSEYAVSSS